MNSEDKKYIDLGMLGCEKSLKESHEDILSVVEKEIGTSDRPIDGPSYIMPNGKFLTIWKSKIPVSNYSVSGSATHRDVQQYLYNKGLVKDDFWSCEDPDLERLGCIRVNGGFEEYIWLPDNRPNETQWNSLLMWLDWYFRFHSKLMVGYYHYAPKTYYSKDYTTDEILKKCKEAYARGYLTESKQDLEKFRQWAGDELANRFFKLKDRLPDRAKDIYYWMSMEKQLLNLKDRYKDAQERSTISNYEKWAHENAIDGLKTALDNVEQTPTRREINKLGKEGSEKIYEDENWLVLKINTYEASVKYGKGTEWCITGNNSDQGREDFNHHTIDSNATIYFFINKKNKLHKYALEYVNDNDWCLFDETDFPHVGYGNSFKRGVDSMGGEHWYKGDARDTFPIINGLPNINKAYDDFENMSESLKESISKYYRLEIEDSFGDREGLWTGAFNLIPTKETIENYPEDFEELTPDDRRNYYQFDYLLNKLSKIKSPGVDTNFNGFRENDIFAFTSSKYTEVKDIIVEMRQVLKELGFKLIIKELDVDDAEISYRDDDQIAFHKSELEKELEEKIVKKGSKWQVQSEKGRNLGTYNTKKEAEDRLKDVEMFKHMNEDIQETDNEGNVLSKEQIEFFKNSKVRDNQGRLLVCYHGTDKDFDEFDISKSGKNGYNFFGTGHYFTMSSNNEYGKIQKKCYLNITNPMLGGKSWIDYCKKNGREWYQYPNLTKQLKEDGYDGIISKDNDTVVAFEPNQIKSITNKNPTNSNNINESLDEFDSIVKTELDTLNRWLDKYGFEVELITNKETLDEIDWSIQYGDDAVGMFLQDLQDNASVFPIALNREAIEKITKEEDLDLRDGIEGTLWHEAGHGIYRFLEDIIDMPEDEEDCVEEFARYKENSELFDILQEYMNN